jgi:hypothetical protein
MERRGEPRTIASLLFQPAAGRCFKGGENMRGINRGLRRAAVLLVLVGAGVLIVGAQAASAQVIEICKSSANGMSGRDFNYTVAPSGGSSFSVGPIKGGRCSGPITVTGASAVITEAQSDPATDVKSVTVRPSARKTSEDLANRRVTVQTGASTASETLVTFTNQPAGGNYGSLKVCKLTETPAYLGRAFSFSVNGGPIVSTEANDAFADPADLTCRLLGTFQQGSVVHVHELVPAGTEVQWIDTDPGENLLDFNTASGDATVQVTAGMTVVYYDDEPAPPAGNGWLEICKNDLDWWWDPAADGTYDFTITDAAGATHSVSVIAGQCSEPIQVAAGVNEIVEAAKANIDLTDVEAFPSDRLLTVNLINRDVTVEVPVSDSPNDETQVHFRNEAQRGQLKVCKALGPGSSDLIGKDFYFSIQDLDALVPAKGLEIEAAATTQCKIEGYFPIGHTVDVRETNGLLGTDGVPVGTEYIDVSGEGQVVIKPGINTITVTNTAKGLLEVCKAAVRFDGGIRAPGPVAIAQPKFQFRIDGGAMFEVQAGKCSMPKRVSVGNHTVSEVAANDYELDPYAPGNGITVFPADREVSRSLATRTVTVSVPWGPNGETLVTFYNRVKLAKVKVCKVIPITSQDSLGGKPFNYTVGETGKIPVAVGPILPGECTFYLRDIPVLTAPGVMNVVTVDETEAPSTTFDVTSITVAGSRGNMPLVLDLTNGTISFNPGPGVNVVTYTNTAKDP